MQIVRPLALADLPGLLDVQLACYGAGYIESAEVFARRLASPANCSLVLLRDGRVAAYLAAYRSQIGKVTPLHGDFAAVDATDGPDTLYLHDMAVHPDHAGQGLASALLAPLWQQAQAEGLRHSALVAVQGAQGYWARHGYAAQQVADAVQQQRLASYGPDAVYMALMLSKM